jgi:hypothetical protein
MVGYVWLHSAPLASKCVYRSPGSGVSGDSVSLRRTASRHLESRFTELSPNLDDDKGQSYHETRI